MMGGLHQKMLLLLAAGLIANTSIYASTNATLVLPNTPAKLVLKKQATTTDSPFTISGGGGDHNYPVNLQALPIQAYDVNVGVNGSTATIANVSSQQQTLCISTIVPEGNFVVGGGVQFTSNPPPVYSVIGLQCNQLGGEAVDLTDPQETHATYTSFYQTLLQPNTTYTCTFLLGFHNSPAGTSRATNLTLLTPNTYTTAPFSITFYEGTNFTCATPPAATPENTIAPTFSITIPPATNFSLAQSTLNFQTISQNNWQQPQSISSNFLLTSNDPAGVNVSLTPTDGSNNYRLTNGSNAVQLSASVRPCGINSPTSTLIPHAYSYIETQYLTQDCNANPGAITLTLPALSFMGTAGVNLIPPPGVYSNTFTLDVSNA